MIASAKLLPMDIHARPGLSGATRLLESANLPSADLTDEMLEHFFYVGSPLMPMALVGIELLGEHALLRSLVVTPAARSKGAGSALVAYAESYAKSNGVRYMYLLTTTADRFFEQRGFLLVARDAAPGTIRSTREFGEFCPASSTVMVKSL